MEGRTAIQTISQWSGSGNLVQVQGKTQKSAEAQGFQLLPAKGQRYAGPNFILTNTEIFHFGWTKLCNPILFTKYSTLNVVRVFLGEGASLTRRGQEMDRRGRGKSSYGEM